MILRASPSSLKLKEESNLMPNLPVIRDGFKNFNFNADLFLGKDKKQWTFSIKGIERRGFKFIKKIML